MKKIILVLLSSFTLLACSAGPKDINITAHTNAKVNLSGYKTFAWLGDAVIVYDEIGRWENPGFDADSEARFNIDKELRAKGFTENSHTPDMLITFVAGVDMDNIEMTMNDESQLEKLENVPKGALVVAIFDANTGQSIWVGVAEANLQQNVVTQDAKERLNVAVNKMFKQMKI
jgi:hypothetical protein